MQVVQILGALMILSAFVGAQMNRIDQRSMLYLVLNAVGSAILTVLGWMEHQWGFVLLEGVWTIVSVYGISRLLAVRSARG